MDEYIHPKHGLQVLSFVMTPLIQCPDWWFGTPACSVCIHCVVTMPPSYHYGDNMQWKRLTAFHGYLTGLYWCQYTECPFLVKFSHKWTSLDPVFQLVVNILNIQYIPKNMSMVCCVLFCNLVTVFVVVCLQLNLPISFRVNSSVAQLTSGWIDSHKNKSVC